MQNTVVCIGELLWDVYPNDKKVGGSSTNVSLHLAKQGINCLLVSAVGDDADGITLINYLTVKNLSTHLIQIKKNLPTSTVIIKLNDDQNATYTIAEPVAWDEITLTDGALTSVENADALVFCSLTCREEKSRETVCALADKARLAIFDMNLREPFYCFDTIKLLLKKSHVLKINENELLYLKQNFALKNQIDEECLPEIAEKFALKAICLTLGGNGAMVWHNHKFYRHNGFKIKVADTVGAGDAFLATFIAGFLAEKEMLEALENACLLGAFVASQPGANPNYNEEILHEFKRNSF
ncbi:fructokinase [Pedobacter sp. UYP30]|uniref:carbohydrate kinase family protein n=1 Tax=Pedobacter sp. UYP30 TaxID=1756400 RepID=UPI00339304FF